MNVEVLEILKHNYKKAEFFIKIQLSSSFV